MVASPNDDTRAGVDELEGIKHIIARAVLGLGRQALELAGEKIIGAFEFLNGRVRRGIELPGPFCVALLEQRLHPFARQEENLAAGLGGELSLDPGEENVLVD